jgi:hypothetical protein
MMVIQRLLSAGVPFSERHVYFSSWESHRAKLNEFTEALSSGSLPMLRLFENYGARFANFEYQLDKVCFKGSDDEILELFAVLDCKAISASLEKHFEQHPDDPHAIIVEKLRSIGDFITRTETDALLSAARLLADPRQLPDLAPRPQPRRLPWETKGRGDGIEGRSIDG